MRFTSKTLVCVIVSILVIALSLSRTNHAETQTASNAPPPTIRIEGRVVADDTGIPIPNARVSPTFGTVDRQIVSAVTDGEGHFVFSFPPGRYNISATKTGYARREVPQSPTGQPLEIRLPRAAVISGRVIDEFGDPVAGARVALDTRAANARDGRTVVTTTTDDFGEYRIGGLAEGLFFVVVVTRGRAEIRQISGDAYAALNPLEKTYYPNAALIDDAAPLSLHAGEERQSIDFVLSGPQTLDQPFAVDSVLLSMTSQWLSPPRGTGVIRGRITDAAGQAISQAHLLLASPNPTDRPTLPRVGRSSVDGRFEFSELGAGRYRLMVSKGGYLSVNADTRSADGTQASPTIELVAGEVRNQVDVSLTRFATLTGRVLDEYGLPVMGARVQALHVRYEGGRRKLVAVALPERLTDDRGVYRLFGLDPGQYIVSAFIGDVASDDVPGYTRTYFPGMATAGDAQFVPVGAGQNVAGLDIPLARVHTARVSGRWFDSQGQPGGGSLTLMPTWRAGSTPAEPVGARIAPDGRFEFRNVSPGEYVIHASRGRTNHWTEGEFGALSVFVNGADLDDLLLQTSAGSMVAGRVSFNTLDLSKLPSPSAIEITAVPVDPDRSPLGGWATARMQTDWLFGMNGLSGPRRLLVTGLPKGWVLEEIRVGGTEVTDRAIDFGRPEQSLTGVEVVLSDRVSQLSGTVIDQNNRPIAGAHVIVFAADRDRWFYRSRYVRDATTDDQGNYAIAALPFGSYYLATASANAAEGPEAWQDPDFLTMQISRAASVTMSEGQRVTRSIRVPSR